MIATMQGRDGHARRLALLALRAGTELGVGLAALPWLRLAPRGDGHAVLVLPGLGADDGSTRLLRGFLKDRGYRARGWGLGRNLGARGAVAAAMLDALDRLSDESGGKVSLVGWSLGGLYAWGLASRRPESVRGVITLGSPLHDRRLAGVRLYERADEGGRERHRPPVPTTSIYSRSDEIVPWRRSLVREDGEAENIEVAGSHLGLGFNPAVLYAVSDRLAQPEGRWRPFDRSGWRRAWYPDPQRPSRHSRPGFGRGPAAGSSAA